jgi:hypothetical protein
MDKIIPTTTTTTIKPAQNSPARRVAVLPHAVPSVRAPWRIELRAHRAGASEEEEEEEEPAPRPCWSSFHLIG